MKNKKLNLLIVDDDEGDRKHIKHVLKRIDFSFECVEAVNIESAIEACNQNSFGCAFLDYKMPGYDGMHGIETMQKLLPDMAIIMVTGKGDELIAAEAIKRGAADYIPKSYIHEESIRHVIENALEKTALRRKVEQQQEELANFARILAHDMKSPVNAIYGYANFIKENLHNRSLEKIAEDFQQISETAQRMWALIDTVYKYTSIDAQVKFERVNMADIVANTKSNLDFSIRQSGARITHDELPVVTGNAPQLEQLLQNLIGNSIKYCKAEFPTIHISARPLQDDFWEFSLQDNGIGIPKESYKQVFDPFKRLHSSKDYEGTGLGLATCKKIVLRHGGDIWCVSKKGQGTTFFFTLPSALP